MAHLITIRLWLRNLLRLVGLLIVGALVVAWYRGYLAGFRISDPPFLLSVVISGALLALWFGLLVFYLCTQRLRKGGARRALVALRIVGLIAVALLVGGGGYTLHRYSQRGPDLFAMLQLGELDELALHLQENGVHLDAVDESGRTLLMEAFDSGDCAATAMLLERGCPLQQLWAAGQNPLLSALNRPGMLRVLLEAGADPNRCAGNEVPALHYAVVCKDLGAMQLLLDGGAELDAVDRRGRTALMRAVDAGVLEAVEQLIALGADVNVQDDIGDTPLHRAVRFRSFEGIRMLLERGADPCRFNFAGFSALHVAAMIGYAEPIEMMSEKSGVGLCNAKGCSAFDAALQGRNYAVARLLLGCGADIDRIKPGGRTALHCALEKGDLRSARFLVEQGAGTRIPNAAGKTAFQIMEDRGMLDLLDHD